MDCCDGSHGGSRRFPKIPAEIGAFCATRFEVGSGDGPPDDDWVPPDDDPPIDPPPD